MAPRRQSIAAAVLAKGTVAALIFANVANVANAADSAARFEVSVTLRSASQPDPTLCVAGGKAHPLGITAIVKCAPLPSPAAQPDRVVSSVLFYMSRGVWLGTVDETMGLGTVTSWRVIRLANRDYLEMMVGW